MDSVEAARAIMLQYSRDGFLNEDSERLGDWGNWEDVTPGHIILATLMAIIRKMIDEGRAAPSQVQLRSSGREVDATFLAVSESTDPLRIVRETTSATFGSIVRILSEMLDEESLDDGERDELFRSSELLVMGIVGAELRLHRGTRGRDLGPWDEAERGFQPDTMVDLGALKILAAGVTRIDPMLLEGKPISVTVIGGRSAIQLQVFRSSETVSWDAVRHKMMRTIAAEGSTSSERSGRGGVELKVELTRRDQSGVRHRRVPMRILGCDGPGWLLRGIVTGIEGSPDSAGDWSYGMFEGAIVALSESVRRDSDPSVFLGWPPDAFM